jgi:hypothetical protein
LCPDRSRDDSKKTRHSERYDDRSLRFFRKANRMITSFRNFRFEGARKSITSISLSYAKARQDHANWQVTHGDVMSDARSRNACPGPETAQRSGRH